MENLNGKVISVSRFTLSNFLCVVFKHLPFVPRDKNDQICTTALYIHSYILWFLSAFNNHPVLVVGAMIMHKMFDAGTKHLSATGGLLKVFLGPYG